MSELDVSDLLTVDQAIAIIDAADVTPRVVEVALTEAQGLRLAQDLVADRDYPPFDKSLMDGYALRSRDAATTAATLLVVGEIAAGQESSSGVSTAGAMAIMTGAPMHAGADA